MARELLLLLLLLFVGCEHKEWVHIHGAVKDGPGTAPVFTVNRRDIIGVTKSPLLDGSHYFVTTKDGLGGWCDPADEDGLPPDLLKQ